MLRALLTGGAGIAVPGVLSGCARRAEVGGGIGPATAVPGGTVIWGKSAEAIALDPPKSNLGSSWDLIQVIYDPLVELDDNLNVVPALAQSWQTPSPTEYVFSLRPDAVFSHGRPLTADDVVETFRRHLDPENPTSFASFIGGPSTTVSKLDDRTVRFRLAAPSRTFLSALSAASAVILPMKEIDAGGLDPTTEMLGTGPFLVQSHEQDQRWVLVRNPHAWRSPAADRLVIPIMPDVNSRIAALGNGSIDIADFDQPDAPLLLSSIPNLAVRVQQCTDFFVLTLNACGATPFADPRVRQAIACGIDREKIRRVALADAGEVTGVVSAAFPGAIPSSLRRDPDRARSLLAEAGHPNLRFEIIYGATAGDTVGGAITQIIQQSLAEIGVTVVATQLEEGVLNQRAWVSVPAQMDATVTYYAAFGGPLMAMRNWSPQLAPFAVGFQQKDPHLTELITQAWQAEGGVVTEAARRAAEAIEQQANTIPLVTKPVVVAYRSDRVTAKISGLDGNVDPMRHVEALSRTHVGGR
ncbi:ABC transporter substrate-binding protein [Sciscionella marina]|uniref:ABC transporter substrate-binding protein n=1 Tax=Sciscionella marina TaxID=508770 RepID=UPI0003629508|nr:ABC transporter substrate-binding protein [Sciscionella marina]